MADLSQLVAALQKADAAGDTQAAQTIASAIKREKTKLSNPAEYDPSSPEFQAKYGASSTGGFDNFMAGAGKAVVDMGRGVKQIGADLGNKVGFVSDETVSGIQGNIDDSRERDKSLLNTGAGIAGNISGNLATIAVPGTIAARGAQALNMGRTATAARALVNPTTYRAAAGTGATYGALMPTATDESRIGNIVGGAVAGKVGMGVVKGAGRVAQPIANITGKAVDKLKDAGVPLDLAQRTGSQFLQRVKTGLNVSPFTSGGQRKVGETQQREFTRAVLKTIGADSDEASTSVMATSKSRLGKAYDDIAERNPIKYDDELEKGLIDLVEKAGKELPADQMRVLQKQIDDVLNFAADGNGQIGGKAFKTIKQSLDRISGSNKSSLGFWARGLRDELKDALGRSSSAADQKLLEQTNRQFANMKSIEGAIDKGGEGLVSPLRLSNTLGTKANRWKSVYGGGDQELVKLAQSARSVLPETLPDSGTAGRMAALGLTTGGAAGVAYLSPENADKALMTAALLYGGPKAMQKLLNRVPDKRRYLADGLKNPAIRKLLQLPSNNRAAGITAKNALLATYLTEQAR